MSVAIFLQTIGIGFICFLLGYYYSIKVQQDKLEREIDSDDEFNEEDMHKNCVTKDWLQARISSIYNEIRGINKKMKINEITPAMTDIIDKGLNNLIP